MNRQSVYIKGLRYYLAIVNTDRLLKFSVSEKAQIPDLLEAQMLTFSSDRVMMVVGFEKIA